jgi:hypothetical protein
MNRQHRQRQAVPERQLFQLVDVGRGFVGHLAMQDLDSVEAEPRGILDYLLDRILGGAEVPVRVGGHRNLDARLRTAARHLRCKGPAPSHVEGPAPSHVEGPAPSRVEGPAPSRVEGPGRRERCEQGRAADSQ